ncbi:MAG: hypothetical protein OEQ53_19320 [Saprospiraceae bacterium]|nr:hypothetical protein [Saprospiraceae bacterium]
MYQIISLLLLFSLGYTSLHGQAYITAMGLRMGRDFGVTLQQRILGRITGQGIVSTNPAREQTTATVLVQLHNPLITRHANFYIGGGVHRRWNQVRDLTAPELRGISGVAGAELTLGKVNLSWDYKPFYHLNATEHPFESETAVSLRYVFVKKIKRKKKKTPFWKQDEKRKRKRVRAKEKRDRIKNGKNGS